MKTQNRTIQLLVIGNVADYLITHYRKLNMKYLLFLLIALNSLSAFSYDQRIEDLFSEGFIFDGATGITYDERDENGQIIITGSGTTRRKSTKLPDDFRDIIKDTGINIVNTGPSSDPTKQARWLEMVEEVSNSLVIKTFNDISYAYEKKLLGVNFYIQKPYPLEAFEGAETFEEVIQKNVNKWMNTYKISVFQLAYNRVTNDILQDSWNQNYPGYNSSYYAGGADEPTLPLTKEGRAVVQEIYKNAGVVDVSHMGLTSTEEIIRIATSLNRPVTANHIGVYILNPWGRNKDDRTICQIAKTNGVVGISPVKSLLVPRNSSVTWKDFIRHMNYIKNLDCTEHAGKNFNMSNHLNIALDTPLEGWEEAINPLFYVDDTIKRIDRWKFIAEKMLYGEVDGITYTINELRRIFGLNLKRVYFDLLPGLNAAFPFAPKILSHPPYIRKSAIFQWEAATFTRMPSRFLTYSIEIQMLVQGNWRAFKNYRSFRTSYKTTTNVFPLGNYRYRIQSTINIGHNVHSYSKWKNFEVSL